MLSYNTLTEPWIPVVSKAGTFMELGIIETLIRAHDLDSIRDPAPPVQFGLYRLLLAFIMDAYQLSHVDDLADVLEKGRFEPEIIDRYTERCGDVFDLFHKHRPFLQSAVNDSIDKEPKSVAYLFQHFPTGTNTIHFHHALQEEQAFSASVCVRGLCTFSPFMTSGGSGYSPSINGAPPWYVLIRGDNLFETLLLNTYVSPNEALIGCEPVAWCTDLPVTKRQISEVSLRSGLTWQPRRVRLIPSDGGRCYYTGIVHGVLVREMVFNPGFAARTQEAWVDPQVSYVISAKGSNSLKPSEDRDLWRDTGPLMLLRQEDYVGRGGRVRFQRPGVVTQYHQLCKLGAVKSRKALVVEAYGLQTDKNKIIDWRFERLSLPAGIADLPNAGYAVQISVEQAEKVAYHLGKAIKIAYPRSGQGNKAAHNRIIDNTCRNYWEQLRPEFDVLLQDIVSQTPNNINAQDEVKDRWLEVLRSVGSKMLRQALFSFDTNAESLRRQVEAQRYFALELSKAFNQSKENKPKQGGVKNDTRQE